MHLWWQLAPDIRTIAFLSNHWFLWYNSISHTKHAEDWNLGSSTGHSFNDKTLTDTRREDLWYPLSFDTRPNSAVQLHDPSSNLAGQTLVMQKDTGIWLISIAWNSLQSSVKFWKRMFSGHNIGGRCSFSTKEIRHGATKLCLTRWWFNLPSAHLVLLCLAASFLHVLACTVTWSSLFETLSTLRSSPTASSIKRNCDKLRFTKPRAYLGLKHDWQGHQNVARVVRIEMKRWTQSLLSLHVPSFRFQQCSKMFWQLPFTSWISFRFRDETKIPFGIFVGRQKSKILEF